MIVSVSVWLSVWKIYKRNVYFGKNWGACSRNDQGMWWWRSMAELKTLTKPFLYWLQTIYEWIWKVEGCTKWSNRSILLIAPYYFQHNNIIKICPITNAWMNMRSQQIEPYQHINMVRNVIIPDKRRTADGSDTTSFVFIKNIFIFRIFL